MSWLSRLAERQIQKARLKGQLDHLEGAGKPLPDRPGDAFVSPGDAVGFRIMAEAGVLPEEITLKKQAAAQRAHLATLTDEAARKAPWPNSPGSRCCRPSPRKAAASSCADAPPNPGDRAITARGRPIRRPAPPAHPPPAIPARARGGHRQAA